MRWVLCEADTYRRGYIFRVGSFALQLAFACSVVWVVVEDPISLFLLFIVVSLLCFGALTTLCVVLCPVFVFAVLSDPFLTKRHVKSCLRKNHNDEAADVRAVDLDGKVIYWRRI